jgi:hypothetical protein
LWLVCFLDCCLCIFILFFNQNWKFLAKISLFLSFFFLPYSSLLLGTVITLCVWFCPSGHGGSGLIFSFFQPSFLLFTLVWMISTGLPLRSLVLLFCYVQAAVSFISVRSCFSVLRFPFDSFLQFPYLHCNSPPLHLFIHFIV